MITGQVAMAMCWCKLQSKESAPEQLTCTIKFNADYITRYLFHSLWIYLFSFSNGHNVEGATHKQVVDLIRSGGDTLTLTGEVTSDLLCHRGDSGADQMGDICWSGTWVQMLQGGGETNFLQLHYTCYTDVIVLAGNVTGT